MASRFYVEQLAFTQNGLSLRRATCFYAEAVESVLHLSRPEHLAVRMCNYTVPASLRLTMLATAVEWALLQGDLASLPLS